MLGYNVRSLRDDPVAVARVVRAAAPDVVCLQEAPRFLGWRWRRARLARRCGLGLVPGARAGGLALLVRHAYTVRHVEHHLLSPDPGLHRRALALAVLDGPPGRLVAACTHLDLRAEPRLRHVHEVLARLAAARRRYRAPVVLAADVNEPPGGPAWSVLAGALTDTAACVPGAAGPTFPSAAPRARIDAVFADPRLAVRAAGVPDGPALAADYPSASDHRPVMAVLAAPG
ncbi:endonuclease/exonuclease/phosphatase family protein [Allonocardiopsis opalescens]|uniref:endonuclease/exonuclease/phosphatase family protein n=1 Tax=Allonocardiopsis opalescens TaxID=1144618 RepID=UPI001FE354BF|nr:endonuclease/exonuclease/phosphatase family protein [Allonocardiopsis opalescens]